MVQLTRSAGRSSDVDERDNRYYRQWSIGSAAFEILFGLTAGRGGEAIAPQGDA